MYKCIDLFLSLRCLMTLVYDLYYMYRCIHKIQKVEKWTEGLVPLGIFFVKYDATCLLIDIQK